MNKIKAYLTIACFLVSVACLYAQETNTPAVGVTLPKALKNIEHRFDIEVADPDNLTRGLQARQTGWQDASTAGLSLARLLSPHHLMFLKENESSYTVSAFDTGRRSVEEGMAQLEYLAHRYSDQTSWEARKSTLHSCMLEALKLAPLPLTPDSEPLVTSRRVMDGYTVENVALETLPGLFVTGSLYRPLRTERKVPVVLSPNGHFNGGRYRADQQYRMATLARMGAIAFSYDLFSWGESQLQFDTEYHRTPLAMSVQILNGLRVLDFLTGLEQADPERVGITGGSGGGSQTILLTALDDRIDVSVPVVMLSSYFNGGCPCESGRPIHLCGGGTSNVEIAAMAAPRPQLVISDGNDWTAHVPEVAFPYLQKIYGYYGRESLIENEHLPEEGHDYGYSKRVAMYRFMAKYLGLDIKTVTDDDGRIDESGCTIEEESALYVFGKDGKLLPERAVRDFEALKVVFE